MDEQFLRTRMILGADAVERLRCSHVIVFGLGGVGSYAAEALARAGVGELTLVDQDTLSVSNINRQLYALHSTVGMYKADVAAARCLDINPALRVHPVCATYDAAHREDFFTARYDYIVDAIDLVSCKLDLVEQARERGIPIISAMGTGNKLDPTLLTVTDLARTSGCPLARVMRRELRRRGIEHLQVVYSLMEMEEYGEANSYIEKVYGRITAVSRVLKTASAPINALLQVKLAACEKAGVQVTLNITSTWKELPISGWEMCKVLSNLIDNAIDAMADLPNGKKHLTITLTENLKEYVFSVANTGTPIPPGDQQRIFEPGVTTKSDGHGMGLFIVRETLRHYGGDIQVTSDAQETVFSGTVPKDTTIPEAKAAQENSINT